MQSSGHKIYSTLKKGTENIFSLYGSTVAVKWSQNIFYSKKGTENIFLLYGSTVAVKWSQVGSTIEMREGTTIEMREGT